ncbi:MULTISPECIES: DCC1-like thiol-disulfide oxidoreductase family protein [unclassified Virgibacillus]|uniref:thiol-disulfide oxidoreductase DCC family protein n=1 Tax=unclassified Virgibacillus TaxID=2620237 RepID=UPI0024DE1A77|nr:DCC1-like thiol-disulfide oxidoreductase family protein [Virgibacillus sp. LDC-1]
MERIILFDGDCHFCDKSVQFILKRDPKGYFKFASLQSKVGKRIKIALQIPESIDSFLFIDGTTYYTKSTAALRVSGKLKGIWKLGILFLVIPVPIRDFLYDQFAKRRYRWFGKKKACRLPSKEMQQRFLSDEEDIPANIKQQ